MGGKQHLPPRKNPATKSCPRQIDYNQAPERKLRPQRQ
jgi:hypothetical protein